MDIFNEEVSKRVYLRKLGLKIIKQLKTEILVADTSNTNDALDDTILEMFNEIEELKNTELKIHDNYTDIPDIELPTRNSGDTNDVRSTSGSVLNPALGNIFIQGRTNVIEMKIP